MYIYISLHIHMHVDPLYLFSYLYTYMFLIYIYRCIHTHIYTYSYVHIYVYTYIITYIYAYICNMHLCCSRRSNKSMQSLSPRAHTLGKATSAAPRTYPWGCSRHAQSAEMASKEPFSISPRFALIKTCRKQVCCRCVAGVCMCVAGLLQCVAMFCLDQHLPRTSSVKQCKGFLFDYEKSPIAHENSPIADRKSPMLERTLSETNKAS